MRFSYLGILFAFLSATLVWQADAGSKLEKSDTKIKAKATATKIGDDGKQTVTITLDIDKGWYIYANPVNHNNDGFNSNKTVVNIAAKEKVKFSVKYPEGRIKKDGKEIYDIYVDTVKLQAEVVRAKGDTSPLEIRITVNACDSDNCLPKGEVKLTVK